MNNAQIEAKKLVIKYISAKFINYEKIHYGNFGHDFVKTLKELDSCVSDGLYTATELILKQYQGDPLLLLDWLNEKKLTTPVFAFFNEDVNICWNLYNWLRLVK